MILTDKIIEALRVKGFMILPFEPSEADIQAIARSFPITGGRKFHAEKAYAALVARRKGIVESPPRTERKDIDIGPGT